MARPPGWKPYFLADGTKVPSVTTIIGRFKESGALMYWAWKEGIEGRDFRETRDRAADAGTLAHQAVEAWLKEEEFTWPVVEAEGDGEIVGKARQAFSAFREWTEQSRLEITDTETRLVSEIHRFGGTLDACVKIGGRRAIADWKASAGLYADYLLQIAAYGILWDENFPSDPAIGGYHLLRFDKVHGDFTHRFWGELGAARKQFLLLREAYDLDAELKERIR